MERGADDDNIYRWMMLTQHNNNTGVGLVYQGGVDCVTRLQFVPTGNSFLFLLVGH